MHRISTLLVCAALAGCGDEPKKAAPDARAPAAEAAKSETGKAAVAQKAWSSVDAKGRDWKAQMGAIQFDTDWKAAMARAKTSKKPLMIFFTEKKSADAEKMAAAAFKDAEVVESSAAFVVTIVDAEDNAPLAEQFNVRTTPMVVYASPTGEILGSTISASDMLGDMKSALDAMKDDGKDK